VVGGVCVCGGGWRGENVGLVVRHSVLGGTSTGTAVGRLRAKRV